METLLSKEVDWKKVVVVSALVGLAALVSGVIVWYYMDQQLADQTEYYEEQLTEEKVESESKKVEETDADVGDTTSPMPSYAVDWHEYKNSEYDFTFRYPKTVSASGPDSDATCGNPLYVTKEKVSQNSAPGESYIMGNFFVVNIRDNKDSAQEIIAEYDPKGVNTVTEIRGTGADSAVLINKPADYDGYPPLAYTHAIFTKNGKVYSINGFQDLPNYGKECEPGSLQIIGSIIETFRFN